MSDANIPIKALEGLMKKVFVDMSLQPGLFWDAALKSNLYLPLARPIKEADEGGDLPIQLGLDNQGKSVLWIFTSPQAMTDYTEKDFSYFKLPGKKMFERIKKTKHEIILIGPEGITLNLDSGLVTSLAEGKVPQPPEENVRNIPKDTKVKVGRAIDNTEELEDKFSVLFDEMEEVEEASFIQVEDDRGNEILACLS